MSGPYPDNGRDAYEDMSEFYRTPHDAECESELTSHGQTPCRCDERRQPRRHVHTECPFCLCEPKP
jgi:hypothetical protein